MKIVAFTGAGISAESGLKTFRQGGMWENMPVEQVAHVQSWESGSQGMKRTMLEFYNQRRRDCKQAAPNLAHIAIAQLESDGHDVTVVTQNVDNLHERAGSSRVIHLHGELMKVKPDGAEYPLLDWSDDLALGDEWNGIQLRPHIVWFGEELPLFTEAFDLATAPDVDLLLVVGTTLEVGPANQIAFWTRAKSVAIVDPNPPEFFWTPKGGFARLHPDLHFFAEPATTGLPKAISKLV